MSRDLMSCALIHYQHILQMCINKIYGNLMQIISVNFYVIVSEVSFIGFRGLFHLLLTLD